MSAPEQLPTASVQANHVLSLLEIEGIKPDAMNRARSLMFDLGGVMTMVLAVALLWPARALRMF